MRAERHGTGCCGVPIAVFSTGTIEAFEGRMVLAYRVALGRKLWVSQAIAWLDDR